MNDECAKILAGLPVQNFDVLEISGDGPAIGGSYQSVHYPDYDACKGPLALEQWDLVIAHQVWEHLAHPMRSAVHVWQMLRPGGYFLITVPFLIRYHPHPLDCTRWTADGLKFFLEDAGFCEVKTDSWGNWECVIANKDAWVHWQGQPIYNDSAFPVHVWGLARKPKL